MAPARSLRWIIAELLTNTAGILLVFGFLEIPVLKYHILAMAIGQCMASFFCVWTVNHDCDCSHFIARTLRGRLKNAISFNMFFHVEHHLFPQVPTCHLPNLAKRLDEAAPELKRMKVF